MHEFEQRGVEVWTISPDPLPKLTKYSTKKKVGFTMLSDEELAVTNLFGITNQQNPAVPHPTSIVIDPQGVVRYIRIDGDYSKRPSVDELLEAIDGLPPSTRAGDAGGQ